MEGGVIGTNGPIVLYPVGRGRGGDLEIVQTHHLLLMVSIVVIHGCRKKIVLLIVVSWESRSL